MATTLVIGLGNRHCGDDAVGPLAADALRPEIESRGLDVELTIGRHDAMDLTNAWRDRGAVHVIDAFRTTEPPGTIRRIAVHRGADLGAIRQAASTHALGLREAIDLAATLDALPRSLTLWGVCGADFDIGAALTPAVEQALPALVHRLVSELDSGRQ
jgi:hydrogenase maturation protease